MEISCTPSDSSWFPNTIESGCSDIPVSLCTVELGCRGFPSTGCILPIRCLSTLSWPAFTDSEVFLLDFLCCLLEACSRSEVVLLPLFLGIGSWVVFIGTSTLSGAFLAGFKDFVTPFKSVNESGRLFARCCKLMIFRTWSSVSWVRGSEDEMAWAFQSISGHSFWYLKSPLMPENVPH